MAESENESDIDDDLMQLLQDSGDESDFEGFGPEDISNIIEVVREIDFDQSVKDINVREDEEFGWTRYDSMPSCAPFTGTPGLNTPITENPEPIDFFNMLFKNEMWALIANQTNLYATNRIEKDKTCW